MRRLIFYVIFLSCVGASAANAADSPSLEYKIKASFLYNFLKYVSWDEAHPSDPNIPVTICVLGEDPFGPSLDELQTRVIEKRRVSIRRLSLTKDHNSITTCHVLFISTSEEDHLTQIDDILGKASVLTVSDIEGAGMITFIIRENRIGLEINLKKAREAELQISSRLLQLAEIKNK